MTRRGQREVTLATAALGLFAAGTYLLTGPNLGLVPPSVFSYVATGCYGLGAVLLVWLGYRLWRQAVPPPLEARPSAVKGPMAFGPEDGLLFQRLGREHELAQLLGLTLNDQIPLIVVMGESGVGKTSLLRAGLPYVLTSQHVQSIYWEAVPTDAPARLLHAIQEQWQSSPVPQDWDELLRLSRQGTPRRVIVLDQFEQLHPDEKALQPIFDLLRRVTTAQMPPHYTTWIVAFRREYDPVWRDFELTTGDFHPPMLSMRLFGEEPAKDVLATLAEAAHLTLDHALVTDLVQAAARDGRVAAVDLGIGLLVLGELAAGKGTSHLSLDDYRFAGGSAGLLTGYLRDRLDRFHEAERQAVLKALLALTDLDT
jgi:AAA ATPase domain